jgi:hypothetical protein
VTPPTASVPEGSKPQGVEQDEFSLVEMASGAKQKVGGHASFRCCHFKRIYMRRFSLYNVMMTGTKKSRISSDKTL